MKSKQILKVIFMLVISYFGFTILDNVRNIFNIINHNYKGFNFVSIPIIISTIIFMFYIFKIRKKNKYLDIIIPMILLFYNTLNGLLYSSNLHTFFIMYIILLIYAFALYLKLDNFSFSLIISFSIMIIITLIIGMLGLLKIIKYLVPLVAIVILLLMYKNRDNIKLKQKLNTFFGRELLIFTILFMISIIGGIGRYVHVYDEYSHWAVDAKAVISYDAFSTSRKIMLGTREYAPVITSWHYILAQYSGFYEQNLYIGLSIFIMIYLMSVLGIKKSSKLSYLIMLSAYSSIFLFGGVYNFSNLYADLAYSMVFAASTVAYIVSKDDKKLKNYLPILFVILTLIKPSGCTAVFSLLLLMMLDYLFNESEGNIIHKLVTFIKKYWILILLVIFSFIGWNAYVRIFSPKIYNYYSSVIRSKALDYALSSKLNFNFIISFIGKLFSSFDDKIINTGFGLTLYQFIFIITIIITYISYKTKKVKKTFKIALPIIVTYLIFFALTALSIFIKFAYFEAERLASFGRYLNCINVVSLMVIVFLLYKNKAEFRSGASKIILITILIIPILTAPFKQLTYFVSDLSDRKDTLRVSQERLGSFEIVNNNTPKNSKVYVIDQKDINGIMAMWYARYYAFPRKINARASAISWKILTESNKDDMQGWGLTYKTLKDELYKYKFDYLYLYSSTNEFYEETKEYYDDYETAKKSKLFKIKFDGKKLHLIAVK